MEIIYKFDTTSETFDNTELTRVQNADKLAKTLYDILNKVKSWYKYEDRESIPVEEVQESIHNILLDNNVDMIELGY